MSIFTGIHNILISAVFILLSTVSAPVAGELLFDNGPPQAIKFPNTMALSSFKGWHVYDDFLLVEDTVVDEIEFSVFHRSLSPGVRAQIRLTTTLLPVGVQGGSTLRPQNFSATPNGLSFAWPSGQLYYGYDVKLSSLDLDLAAGGHILSVAMEGSGFLAGYSWQGGPDTPQQPGLTCYRQRFYLGTRSDYCKGGHFSFKIFGDPQNTPPTANAGPDQSIRAGDVAMLDGGGSFDDNTATADLIYSWSLDSLPPGSATLLSDASTKTLIFLADVAGTYLLSLVVTDENGASSEPDYVEVSSDNLAPTAAVGADQLVVVGDTVMLDGSASADPENDPLFYDWKFNSLPSESTASFTSGVNVQTSFVADLAGDYLITLDIADLIGPGIPASQTVTAASPEDYIEIVVLGAYEEIIALLDGITNSGNQQALTNFLLQAVQALQNDDIATAISKVENAIERTDGCVLRGAPDGNGPNRDWITDCGAQATAYTALTDALLVLRAQ